MNTKSSLPIMLCIPSVGILKGAGNGQLIKPGDGNLIRPGFGLVHVLDDRRFFGPFLRLRYLRIIKLHRIIYQHAVRLLSVSGHNKTLPDIFRPAGLHLISVIRIFFTLF